MKLRYKASSDGGKIITGAIESGSLSDAAAYLRMRGLFPIEIVEQKEADTFKKMLSSGKVKSKDLVLFTRQLSSMLGSGLTLIKSLEILKDQASNKIIQETIGGILLEIQEGTSFSSAIAKYPAIFPPIYVSLVKAGESSGVLDKVFLRLATNLEKQQKLRGKVKSALMYPAIVMVIMFAVSIIMLVFVMPQLAKLYVSLNAPLPAVTKITLGISSLMLKIWPLIIGLMFVLGYSFIRWKKTPKGTDHWDSFILRVPLIGMVQKKTILAEFSRTFGLLVGTGTLVVDALSQSANVTGNTVYENIIKEVAKRVEKGVKVGEAIGYFPQFPPLLVQLVKVGEETGKMDENLLKASEYFEEEVDQSVKTLTTAMEPLIMIVLGLGVGFLVFSVITPIYGVLQSVH